MCGNASFTSNFMTGAKFQSVDGALSDLCSECTVIMEARRGTYVLREEVRNPVVKAKP